MKRSCKFVCKLVLSGDLSFGRITNAARSVNVNAPRANSPFASRPGPLDTNIFEEQNSGKGKLDIEFLGFSQQNMKWAQLFFGAVRIHRIDDMEAPQSTYTDAGEMARSSNQPVYQAFGNGLFRLPTKIELSTDLYIAAGAPYNILTGMDNNGDGDFNDRPQFATATQPGAVRTPYGFLVDSGGTGTLARNRGTLPTTFHLDAIFSEGLRFGVQPASTPTRCLHGSDCTRAAGWERRHEG